MWKDIPTREDVYEINENGDVRNKITGNLIKGDINNAGYYRVCLYKKPRKQRYFRHKLVAELFIPNPDNYKEVNHIDGNKGNKKEYEFAVDLARELQVTRRTILNYLQKKIKRIFKQRN